MNCQIKGDWYTASGLRAIYVWNKKAGHYCGYVGVDTRHPLWGKEYGDAAPRICVRGGLTFSGRLDQYFGDLVNLWWFGFDCAHCDDQTNYNPTGIFRTEEFVIEECESLAEQLVSCQVKAEKSDL